MLQKLQNIPNWLKVLWFFPNVLLRMADYNPLMYFWKLFFNPPSLKYSFELKSLDYVIYSICLLLFGWEYQSVAVRFDYRVTQLPTTFLLLLALGACLYLFGIPVFVLVVSIFVYPCVLLWRVAKWIFDKFKK